MREAGERRDQLGGETGVRSDETRHRGYAQLGLTLILKIPDCRTSRSMIAAVMNQVNVRFMSPGGHCNFLHPWPGQNPPPDDGRRVMITR